jgi:signal transduction histidine kinase
MVPLECSRLLRYIPPSEVEFIRGHSEPRRAVAGTVLFREGQMGDGLYILHAGTIDITVAAPIDREYLLMRLEQGEHFGEMAVFDGGPRSASATALTDVELTFIPTDTVNSLLKRSPELAASLVRDASLRIREFNRRFLKESLRGERLTLVERLARSIVHDFRNPLNVIGIAADLAAEDKATPVQRREARDRVRKQVEVLNRMMQELLDFTRAVPLSVVLPKISYAKFLREVLFELQPEGARRGVKVEILGELPDVQVRLDPPRFSRVFANFAQNAFDALSDRADGRVTLRVDVTPTHVLTEFADNGPGIPMQVRPHVFEPFVTHGKAHGTGLGLAICERIVVEHGGKIFLESEAGHGATFAFTLPLPQPGETDVLNRRSAFGLHN